MKKFNRSNFKHLCSFLIILGSLLVAIHGYTMSFSEPRMNFSLPFNRSQLSLTSEQKQQLDNYYQLYKDYNFPKLSIEGHTDSLGKEAANQKLSEKWAHRVKEYLVEKGYPEEKIEAKSYGEIRPIAENQTKEGRIKNRRVEIKTID